MCALAPAYVYMCSVHAHRSETVKNRFGKQSAIYGHTKTGMICYRLTRLGNRFLDIIIISGRRSRLQVRRNSNTTGTGRGAVNYAFCIILHTVLDVSDIDSFVIGLVHRAQPIPEEVCILLFFLKKPPVRSYFTPLTKNANTYHTYILPHGW